MSEEMVDLETIKKWLEEGKEEPETFVDLRWEILGEERGEDGRLKVLVASHQQVPVRLIVVDLEREGAKMKVLRLVVETTIKTIDLPPEVKLSLYRFLLESNKLPLVKFYLFSPSHEVAIATDVDKRLLSKEEFEEALASLLLGYLYLSEKLPVGFKERIREAAQVTLIELVRRWYERGVDRSKALENLVKAGMDRETAERILSLVYRRDSSYSLTM